MRVAFFMNMIVDTLQHIWWQEPATSAHERADSRFRWSIGHVADHLERGGFATGVNNLENLSFASAEIGREIVRHGRAPSNGGRRIIFGVWLKI